MRNQVKLLLNYFLQGLLVIMPISLTIYLIYLVVVWLDSLVPVSVPGLGLLIVLASITLIGFLATGFITNTLLSVFDRLISKVPFIKLIYTSIKDFMSAFVGDKKRFTEPVMVEMTSTGVMKLGFVTSKDLTNLNLTGYVGVYFPHSYNFSGNLFIVPTDKVKPIDANSTEVMKFIVSGGVTNFDQK